MNYRNNDTNIFWNYIEVYYHQGETEGKTMGVEPQMK